MKKLFFLLMAAGLSLSACGKSKAPKGLGDALEIKSGYFLQLYINDRLLNSRVNRVGANYSIECVYDEKADGFVVFLRDKFPSKAKMLDACKGVETSVLKTFEQFNVRAEKPVVFNVLEMGTKSQWRYEKGELKMVNSPATRGKGKAQPPAAKK
jgi:hypothetical protein